MASQWIKVEHVTPDKPEVDSIAQRLGIDPDAVVGKLLRFWIWADQQSVSGNRISVTKTLLNRITHQPGFADALIFVGWIVEGDGGFSIPNFDRHNGNSSKSRAEANLRVSTHREMKRFGNEKTVTKPLPEKRREEKSKEQPLTPSGPWFSSPLFSEAWKGWEKSRKKKAGEFQYKALAKLAAGNLVLAIQILNQSADNGWTGLFPMKGQNGTNLKSRSQRLDDGAEILFRDLGGSNQGNPGSDPAHSPVSGAGAALAGPISPLGG